WPGRRPTHRDGDRRCPVRTDRGAELDGLRVRGAGVSTFDYGRPRAAADRLIKRSGVAATLRRPTNTGPEWDPTITWAETGCTVVVTEFSNREVDGTRVLATDKK